MAFFRTLLVARFIGMCAGFQLHASLILAKYWFLFFQTIEKTCLSSVVFMVASQTE